MSRCPHSTPSRRSRSPLTATQRGFTLVEILVVVAIIVILMAILIPVAMRAISQARNAAIGLELSQLKTGMEEYKKEHGDYPPSMGQNYLPANRYGTVAERHLLRCYPKMDPAQKDFFYNAIAWRLGNDEAIVFWLGLVANDPRYPFKNFVADNSTPPNVYFAPLPGSAAGATGVYPGPYTRYVHFEFDERRVRDLDSDNLPSYAALYSRDTPYVYFDSRTYRLHLTPATAAVGACQPFNDFDKVQATLQPNVTVNPDTTFVNPNTFQIHCAGQDGNYGMLVTAVDPSNNFSFLNNWQTMVKTFGKAMNNTNEEDSDNMADFTEGRRLIDHRAP